MSRTGKRDRDGYVECARAQRAAHRLAREKRIPASAWRVLSVIIDHTAAYSKLGSPISQAKIAEMAGYADKSSVRKALTLLEEHGIIECDRRPGYRSYFRLPSAASGTGSSAGLPCATSDPHLVPPLALPPSATRGTTYEKRLSEEETYSRAPHGEYVSTTEKTGETDSLARVDSGIPQACAGDADSPSREIGDGWGSGRDVAGDSLLVAKSGDDEAVKIVPPPADLGESVVADALAYDAFGYPIAPDDDAEIAQKRRAAKFRALRDRDEPRPPPEEDEDAA